MAPNRRGFGLALPLLMAFGIAFAIAGSWARHAAATSPGCNEQSDDHSGVVTCADGLRVMLYTLVVTNDPFDATEQPGMTTGPLSLPIEIGQEFLHGPVVHEDGPWGYVPALAPGYTFLGFAEGSPDSLDLTGTWSCPASPDPNVTGVTLAGDAIYTLLCVYAQRADVFEFSLVHDEAAVDSGQQLGFTATVTSNQTPASSDMHFYASIMGGLLWYGRPLVDPAVTVTIPLPPGMEGVSWSVDVAGSTLEGCQIMANSLACNGPLPPGESRSVHFVASTTLDQTCGEIALSATAALAGAPPSLAGSDAADVLCHGRTIKVVNTVSANGVATPGLGWMFTLAATGCDFAPVTTATDGTGTAVFAHVPADGCHYTVTEQTKPGWLVSPSATQFVPDAAPGSTTTVAFDNVEFNPLMPTPAPPTPPSTPPTSSTPSPTPTATPPAAGSPTPPLPPAGAGESPEGRDLLPSPTPKPPATGSGSRSGSDGFALALVGAAVLTAGLVTFAFAERRLRR